MNTKGFALQPWVATLPIAMQTLLMTGIRGCDTASKDHVSKKVTRAIRASVVRPSRPIKAEKVTSNFFCIHDRPPLSLPEGWEDEHPHHFFAHILHVSEVLAYKHPNASLRTDWKTFYERMCRDLHMPVEAESVMDKRLSDETPYVAPKSMIPTSEVEASPLLPIWRLNDKQSLGICSQCRTVFVYQEHHISPHNATLFAVKAPGDLYFSSHRVSCPDTECSGYYSIPLMNL